MAAVAAQQAQHRVIAGSISIPAAQLPAALQAPAEEFQRQYRCARPGAEDLVVVYSRTHTRAAWAAQVAADMGLRNCFVLLQVRACCCPSRHSAMWSLITMSNAAPVVLAL